MIEGNPHCESELKKINDNYTIALLSDEVKEVDFYTLKNDLTATGASYYKENTDVYDDDKDVLVIKRKTQRLDDLFEEDSVFDLIKLDTQGSEIDILKGGLNILKKSTIVIIEADIGTGANKIGYNQGAPNKSDVIYFMHKNNFKEIGVVDQLFLFYPDGNSEAMQQDLIFVNEEKI